MISETDPDMIIGPWANSKVSYAELGINRYIMFQKDVVGHTGGGVLSYFRSSTPAVQVHLDGNADHSDSFCCSTQFL